MKNCILALISILIIPHYLYSQIKHDYVITSHGDTVQCSLESQLFGLPKYHPVNKDTLIKISTDNVREYGFHNKDYPQVSIKIAGDDARKFLPRLEKGAICLYESASSTAGTYNAATGFYTGSNNMVYWYAAKNTTDSISLIKTNQLFNFGPGRKQRQKDFGNMMADNPEVLEKFNSAKDFGFKAIRAAIVDYNTTNTMNHPVTILHQ